MTIDNTCLLWIDLETTGLSATSDVPLELGLAVTDMWGKIFAERSWLIHEENPAFSHAMARGADHEIVGPMHDKSGLWDDLTDHPDRALTRAEVDMMADNWLASQGVLPGTLPMCGSSIGSLDRPFILAHFPTLNQRFSYRNVDISSIKELCRRFNPRIFEAMPATGYDSSNAAHRVLEDIHTSIKEYQFYLDNFLFVSEDV